MQQRLLKYSYFFFTNILQFYINKNNIHFIIGISQTPIVKSSSDLKIGDRVIISSGQGSKLGILRYRGATQFAPGEWCGIELDDPLGKNNGTVEGIK